MQNQSPYPPGGYPPQGQYQQQPYPPQQQQGPYGSPAPYGGYPPPQQPYGAPPPGQYPPPGAPYGQPPQQQPYGAPGQYSQSAPPSLGYVPGQSAPVDMTGEATALRDAMKRFGTNEATLIRVLSRPDPLQMVTLRRTFDQRFNRHLLKDIDKETSGYFREGLMALVRGPLEEDVYLLNKAIAGLGTKESLLNDVLLARSNADLHAIKAAYHHAHGRTLEADVRGDLSLKTEQLFAMVLAGTRADETAPVYPQQVDADVAALHQATEGTKLGTDQATVCSVLSQRSDGQIRAIAQAYHARYHRELAHVIAAQFSGHMKDALLRMLACGVDRAKADAQALEDAMKGPGTKDVWLVSRVVRLHWDRQHLQQVKGAYRHFHRRELSQRIRGETNGDYQRLMVALVEQ
ncbi:MAG: hypothetical protein M1822_006151 [Bathelium mastoideum]|nr:MAG: hypothetical protein M1822_006151 [Bathelium mastoideum]